MQDSCPSPSSFVHQSITSHVSTVVDQVRVSMLTGRVTTTSSCYQSPPQLGLVKGVIGLGTDCAVTGLMEKVPHAQLVQLHAAFPDLKITLWHDDLDFPGGDGVVIDALLGVQARGALRGVVAQVVAKLNAARAARFFRTVALDLPTGLAPYEDGAAPPDRDDAVVAEAIAAVDVLEAKESCVVPVEPAICSVTVLPLTAIALVVVI